MRLIALLVMVSRTRFGGPLAVNIGGRAVVQFLGRSPHFLGKLRVVEMPLRHSCLQILVGSSIGACLGVAAFWSLVQKVNRKGLKRKLVAVGLSVGL